LDKEVPIKF